MLRILFFNFGNTLVGKGVGHEQLNKILTLTNVCLRDMSMPIDKGNAKTRLENTVNANPLAYFQFVSNWSSTILHTLFKLGRLYKIIIWKQ